MLTRYAERALHFLFLLLLLPLCTYRLSPRPSNRELACFSAAILLLSERMTFLAATLAPALLSPVFFPTLSPPDDTFLAPICLLIPAAIVNELLTILLLLLLGRYVLHLSWQRSCLPALLYPFLRLLSGVAINTLASL